MLKTDLQDFYYKKNEGKRILEEYEKYCTKATKVTSTFNTTEGRTNIKSDKVRNKCNLNGRPQTRIFKLIC